MKIKTVKIKNFRSYKDEVEIEFGNLTAFVGKNDIGKSTILEALDIFFNDSKGIIKIDKDDINKQALAINDTETIISVCFEELPVNIIIDATNQTTLQAEFLLNSDGNLEIIKKYSNAGKEKVFIKANHPTNDICKDLLQKKNTDLQRIIRDNSIPCDNQTINAVMRTAIWQHFNQDLGLSEIEIDVTKGDTKSIWEKLESYLPLYSLFQSDRKNSDGDNEVQDVASRTLEKIREMNPEIAGSLTPVIPTTDSLKWGDIFKSVSIAGDENIPINKRGSGVKRLILLNFFRAEAERRKALENIPSIIYAIEEPETSQHTEHQRRLIKAFLDLAETANTQVIITTHSAVLVKELDFTHLRLIKLHDSMKTIEQVLPNRLPYPSLNEVNFLAFSEVTEEYHNELYGYIELERDMANYRRNKATIQYHKLKRDGTTTTENIVLTDYIRHQIHHPENTHNRRFTFQELKESIDLMRDFI